MDRPLERHPVPHDQVPFFDKVYLHLARTPIDPTMTWGTVVDVTALNAYVRAASVRLDVLVSPVHVLLKAVAIGLVEHPELRRRVVGRRLYDYKDVNIMLSFQDVRGAYGRVLFLKQVDQLGLAALARAMWKKLDEARRPDNPLERATSHVERLGYRPMGWLLRAQRMLANRLPLPALGSRLARYNSTPVLINCMNFPGAPPLRFYKATQLGVNSWTLHVAMGAVEQRPTVVDGQVVPRPIMPLYIRGDHRLGDAIRLGRFVATVRNVLLDPTVIPDE